MPDYRGHHARNGLDRSRRLPRRSEILNAIPPGCRRVIGRRAGQDLADGLALMPEFAGMRSHARDNALAIVADLTHPDHLQYREGLSIDPRAGLCARVGISPTTWKAHRARLHHWGVVRVVTPGRKYWHGTESRNDAAIYVLCLPRGILRKLAEARRAARRRDKTRPPTVSPTGSKPSGRAALPTGPEGQRGPPSGRADMASPRNAGLAAGSAAGRAMAAVARHAGGPNLSDGWCGHIARPYLADGWTPADFEFACTHTGLDGQFTSAVISTRRRYVLQAWLRSWWLDDEGLPRQSPSQRAAAAAAELRAQQAAEQAGRERATAAARPPSQEYLAMREALFPGLPSPAGQPPEKGRKT